MIAYVAFAFAPSLAAVGYQACISLAIARFCDVRCHLDINNIHYWALLKYHIYDADKVGNESKQSFVSKLMTVILPAVVVSLAAASVNYLAGLRFSAGEADWRI